MIVTNFIIFQCCSVCIFIEIHTVPFLLQYITSGIVYKRPDDPIDFMISECAKLKEKRETGSDMILDIVKQKNEQEEK